MNVFSGIIGGENGVLGGVKNLAEVYIENKDKKREFELEVQTFLHNKEMEMIDKGLEVYKEFNDRIIQMEGTAKDLSQFGWVGSLIILLRGAFRPLVSYGMAAVDVLVFSGKVNLPENEQVVSVFWIINLVIFVFYFGERAIKNIAPVLAMYFGKDIKTDK